MNFGYKLLADGAYVIELEDPTGSSNDYIDVKEGSAGLRLEISGLSAGEHTLMAYHNASEGWTDFCCKLRETNGCESEMFSLDSISTADLRPNDCLRIGWLPDRICVVRYLGNNRFVATDCQNSTMQAGDTFTCLQFAIGQPLYMTNFNAPDDGTSDRCYVAGQKNGLTTLELADGGSENGKV